MRNGAWKRRAAILLSLVAGCDLGRVTAPSPSAVIVRQDEPRLGPLRSYRGAPDFAELEALSGRPATVRPPPGHFSVEEVEWTTSLSRQETVSHNDFTAANVEDGPFFVYAYTMVGITKSGRRSNANVVAMSGTNTNTTIRHNLLITLTTPGGVRSFPEVEDVASTGNSLTTIIPISGINCTTNARLAAQTTHRAGAILSGTVETAFSIGDDDCGGDDLCEPSDEPPTQVAPGPSEPGYDPGSGGGGSGGEDCGDNPGGTNPPSGGCHDEYVYVEVSNDGGVTWTVVWEGWAVVCL